MLSVLKIIYCLPVINLPSAPASAKAPRESGVVQAISNGGERIHKPAPGAAPVAEESLLIPASLARRELSCGQRAKDIPPYLRKVVPVFAQKAHSQDCSLVLP